MKKQFVLAFLSIFSLTIIGSYAQETRLFVPIEIKKAYDKGTRSYDGKPGKNYWQNTAEYNIKLTVIPSEKRIEGYEEVVYHNNSPDDINSLVVRLYGDVFKMGSSRDYAIDANDINNGVILDDVVINGSSYNLKDNNRIQKSGTNITFLLQQPLRPDSILTFKTFWKQEIASHSLIRTGAYDSTTFFIAYWYPQIAVYDDIFGWDKLDYTLNTEFYNNLSNYDVEITVPEEYVVWATGTFENAAEVLPVEIYNRYNIAQSSEEVLQIISGTDLKNGFKSISNIWRYRAYEVTDFAFALSDHYQWDAAIQRVADNQVFISSAHPADTAGRFNNHVELQQKAMHHFSEDIPGIPYPYESFTTFVAKGGVGSMEFPMMANNRNPGEKVTIHEMFHSYMPMYVRTNERRWAWMDEGWAVYNTEIVKSKFFEENYKMTNLFTNSLYFGFVGTIADKMGTISDLPLITSSQFLTTNYGYASYRLPAMVYTILHQHLGEELFMECYREYILRWAKKSPTPYDFFYTFNDVSGQDLGWLWKPWFFDFGIADLAIQSFEKGILTVTNQGNKPVPIFLEVDYNKGESRLITKSASAWADGDKEILIEIPERNDVEKISLNTMIIDDDLSNNFFPSISSLYSKFDVPKELCGHYTDEENLFNIYISIEDGIMYYNDDYETGLTKIMYPINQDQFCSLDGWMTMIFIKDDSGNYSGMEIDYNGWTLEVRKLE